LWVAALCLPGLAIWVALSINLVFFIVDTDTSRNNGAMNVALMLFLNVAGSSGMVEVRKRRTALS
jgi:hypothetical protein